MIQSVEPFEIQYKKLINRILEHGDYLTNRTNIKTIVLFDEYLKIDISKGFPIPTSKKVDFNKAYHEFIWFIEGMTTTSYLKLHNINWWDQYADNNGNLGKTYGYQLRSYNGYFDQLDYILNEFRLNKETRRAHITLWNPTEIYEVGLPVCYTGFTFVKIKDTLNMTMNFRSSDVFLGLPYDICLGALFLNRVAKELELKPKMLGIRLDNAHIYKNHIKQCKLYVKRKMHRLPVLIGDKLDTYVHEPFIKAKLNN